MKHKLRTGAALLMVAALGLAGCGSGDDSSSDEADGSDSEATSGEAVTLTMSAWSLDTTPEFQLLADAFHEANPDVTIELTEYDAAEYDTQITADLAAGTAPDLYVLKNLRNFATFRDGGQLADVSEVVSEIGDGNTAVDFYEVDDGTYAAPYRQDTWFLFYNKELFDQAGVDYPTEAITWDDYADLAQQLTDGLDGDVVGSYQHSWQSTLQGFALAQTPGADLLSGQFDYLEPYYERVLAMEQAGTQTDYATVSTSGLTYQGQFGTQKAAMMNMGSWYVATLIAQQESGDADTFEWGIAPAPQLDSSSADLPVSFGDPTGIGINPAVDDAKLDAAKAFLTYIASEDMAIELAGIGIKPAYTSDAVSEAYFGGEGVPQDELSVFAFGTHDTRPENPVSTSTAAIQTILEETHSAVMTDSTGVADGIAEAETRVAAEVG